MAEPRDLKLPLMEKLQSTEQQELLDVVDSLRACGLSEIVALPQLIVCGDQSSGKSSVLEAISGIPFPKADGLCTRFATEIVLRRERKDGIYASIVPGKDQTQANREKLLDFRHELTNNDDFESLFKSAQEAMGLLQFGKTFSNDVLRVEICGPSQPQLTLVDLPGLIHTSIMSSQFPGDVQLVHNLVSQYLENPRSIILAVVSAKNDIGLQIILDKARQFDPKGSRTLGIITKPDALPPGSKSEKSYISLARNEEVKLSLGWHVVKNVDSAIKQNDQDQRDHQETRFFQESNFNCLPFHIVGIQFLRARLSKVLFGQIRKELPRLVEDIENQISSAKILEKRLGPSRTEVQEQRLFLVSLSESFHAICRDAVRGDYDHDFFRNDSNPERRLCANVMNLHFEFATTIRNQGAMWRVEDENVRGDERFRTREEAIKDACRLLKKSRGRELPGLPNPLLVGELFCQYSQLWGGLARDHIKKVWETTSRFLGLLLLHLTDDDVSENIFRHWLYPIMEEKLTSAYGKLDELLEVHKDFPMTTNPQFISNSKTSRHAQNMAHFNSVIGGAGFQPGQKVTIDELNRLFPSTHPTVIPDMDLVAAEEAFDNMNAFYEVAINLFTDNVPNLAIQAQIIREVPKIFCPTAVVSMDPDIVKKMAGETEEKSLEREAILQRLSILEKGARICKQYAMRPQSYLNQPEGSKMSDLPSLEIRPNGSEATPAIPVPAPKKPSASNPQNKTVDKSLNIPTTPSQSGESRSTSPHGKTGSREETARAMARLPTPRPGSNQKKQAEVTNSSGQNFSFNGLNSTDKGDHVPALNSFSASSLSGSGMFGQTKSTPERSSGTGLFGGLGTNTSSNGGSMFGASLPSSTGSSSTSGATGSNGTDIFANLGRNSTPPGPSIFGAK